MSVENTFNLAEIIVHYSTLYLIGVVSVLIGFPLVKLGNKWGKILGDQKFKSRSVLFVGVIVSVFIMAILFDIATPFVETLISSYIYLIPLLLSAFTLILYGWFCVSCEFNPKWSIVCVLILIPIANIVYLYFAGYFPH